MMTQPSRGLKGHVLLSDRPIILRVNATCPMGATNVRRIIPQAMSWFMTIFDPPSVVINGAE